MSVDVCGIYWDLTCPPLPSLVPPSIQRSDKRTKYSGHIPTHPDSQDFPRTSYYLLPLTLLRPSELSTLLSEEGPQGPIGQN